ncbi:MAG TPA: efflux transporter outer membrane subunit [Planctomycetota bacterium]|nr:efflux transporter outer membrane subunit [Planctomycetota bacterium]
MSRLACVLAVIALAGCDVGREPVVLAAPLADAYPVAVEPGDADLPRWWLAFDDPAAGAAVDAVLAGNRELRAAAATLDRLLARHDVVAAAALPTAGAGANVTYRDPSDETPEFDPRGRTWHAVGAYAAWEVDLWGAVRRGREAAAADVAAAGWTLADLRRALAAEAVRAVVGEAVARRRRHLAERRVATLERLAALRADAVVSGVAIPGNDAGARAELSRARADAAAHDADARALRLRLAALAGWAPTFAVPHLRRLPDPMLPPATVPADLMRRRPDVRAAERRVVAAVARVGVVAAEAYPRLTLSGSIGLESVDAATLFSGDALAMAAGPALRWTLFDGGRVRALVREADAEVDAAVARYEGVVIEAQRAVAAALVAHGAAGDRRRHAAESLAALDGAASLARARAESGLALADAALAAEADALAAGDAEAVAVGAEALGFIAVAQELGGGWDPDQDPVAGRLGG